MNNLKKICLVAFSSILILIPNNYANAAVYSASADGGVHVATLTTSSVPISKKRVNVHGISKDKYTSLTFNVTKSQSFTFGSNESMTLGFDATVVKLEMQSGTYREKTVQLAAGVSLTVDKSAPNGTYYLYELQDAKKGVFSFYYNGNKGTEFKGNKTLYSMPTIKKPYLKAIKD